MGGAVRSVAKVVGVDKPAPTPAPAPSPVAEKAVQRASQGDMEMAARRRGARRRGAMLMSDARLNPTDETLGGGNNLG